MDNRTRELIAIGASVTANCQPCLAYHVRKAQEIGAEEKEILEAITVAKMVRTGAMTKMDQFAATVVAAAEPSENHGENGCGCGR